MKVKVHLLPARKEMVVLDLPEGATAEDAMRALGLLPDGWIALKGGEPVPIDERLDDGDEMKLVSVASGG